MKFYYITNGGNGSGGHGILQHLILRNMQNSRC